MTTLLQLGPRLLAKAEYENPTGSIKDRAARAILDAARLSPGTTVIEPTSGNMGIALAALCRARGYRCIIVMPDSMSKERIALMTAYGAQVELTPGHLGMNGAVEKAAELAAKIPRSFLPGQFNNPNNALAHYRTTGPEVWAQTVGKIDIFVAGVGTGGTITGTGRFLKEQNPNISILAVEPASSPLLSEGKSGTHGIQGIGANFVPQILDRTLFDGILPVTDEDALAAARQLNTQGIPAGISSGANVHAAKLLAAQHPEKTIVTVLPDHANRYGSLER
ncbi:MAG: cysteine synthase family protein [Oscillospiraceae bacterium]|nr:cysteine synthase family protein [Oscillospiraceae bacterium]